MAELKLPYGDGLIEGESALSLRLLEPHWPPSLDARALLESFPGGEIARFLKGKSRVTVVLPDQTRPCRAPELLGLLEPLLSRFDVTLLTANGLHPKMSPQVLGRLLGMEVLERWPVVQHDPDTQDLVPIGTSPFGHEVALNPLVANADAVVTLSVVSLHYFAGFGGGRKMILPGTAGRKSINANHGMLVDRPNPGPGRLQENPLHEEMRWVEGRLEGRLFHLVVGLSAEGKIAALWGFPDGEGFESACQWVRAHHVVPVDRKYPFAVVSCGGLPKDINVIQAHKALEFAHRAVEEGGVILLLAACPQGLGSTQFLPWFRFAGDGEGWRRALLEDYQVNGQTALSWHRKSRSHKVWMLTKLTPEETGPLEARVLSSLQEGLDGLVALYGTREGLLIPHGGSLMPEVR